MDKMEIVLIKIESTSENWSLAWEKLLNFEKDLMLICNEFMGKLTLFANSTGNLSEKLNNDFVLRACINKTNCELGYNPLSCLSWSNETGESIYCYDLNGSDTITFQQLSNKLSLLHSKMIFMQKLNMLLEDRNNSIQNEKTELQRDLIHLLHTKLIINQGYLPATEELENNIEWLSSSFAKLVGSQNLNRVDIKGFKSKLDNIERQINQDHFLNKYLSVFQPMTKIFHESLDNLQLTNEELSLIREEFLAAIDIVQSKLQVINERTNISTQEQIKKLLEVNAAMQHKSVIFQYAAGLIEFIVLAYYSHTLWSHLAHTAYTIIPTWIQFIVVMTFSANTVILTHFLAEYLQGDTHVCKKMIFACITLALILILVFYFSAAGGNIHN